MKHLTIGYDINKSRIDELNCYKDKTLEIANEDLKNTLNTSLSLTSKIIDIKDCNIYIVTVPTPVDKYKKPDLTFLIKASSSIGKILKNDIVIYESTVYPGCTEEECVPILEKESNLEYNKDFFCGYSPERINPEIKLIHLQRLKKLHQARLKKLQFS